jgi:glycosyl-4,4'-diaponeurosporenoate acyltransferase
LRIKRWKDHLPETGGRGGGISKRHLLGHTPEDLDRFGAECRRGELTHWAIVWATPVYRLWNTPETFVLVAGCSIVGAAPCIAVLRYNRARLQHLGVAA